MCRMSCCRAFNFNHPWTVWPEQPGWVFSWLVASSDSPEDHHGPPKPRWGRSSEPSSRRGRASRQVTTVASSCGADLEWVSCSEKGFKSCLDQRECYEQLHYYVMCFLRFHDIFNSKGQMWGSRWFLVLQWEELSGKSVVEMSCSTPRSQEKVDPGDVKKCNRSVYKLWDISIGPGPWTIRISKL